MLGGQEVTDGAVVGRGAITTNEQHIIQGGRKGRVLLLQTAGYLPAILGVLRCTGTLHTDVNELRYIGRTVVLNQVHAYGGIALALQRTQSVIMPRRNILGRLKNTLIPPG